MDIFESLENLEVSESCFNDIMGILEELLLERNNENREKKEQWENKLNRISDKEKIKKTAEIKAEANREKEARNKAYNYSNSAVNPKDPMDYEIGMAYSDSYHNDADDAQDRKNSLIQKFSKKFKNRRIEECFDEIMGIVEDILSEDIENYIIKKYGEPEYVKDKKETHHYDFKTPHGKADDYGDEWQASRTFPVPKKSSKSGQLIDKLHKAQFNELNQTEYGRHNYDMDRVPEKPNDFVTNKIRKSDKNSEGDKVTRERTYRARIKMGRSYQRPKSDEQRVEDSIARNKAKQEKKNK